MAKTNEELKDKINGAHAPLSERQAPNKLQVTYKHVAKQIKAAASGDEDLGKQIYVSFHEAVTANPKLMDCTTSSLGTCMVLSAMTGLLPEPWKDAAYVPYGKQAQFQPTYLGLVKLARQCGTVRAVQMEVVHEGDHFFYNLGTEPKLEFMKAPRDRGDEHYVYCILELSNGNKEIEVMTYDEVEKIRKGCANSNSPAWRDHWEAMAKKTILKRALKTHSKDRRLSTAISVDNISERPDLSAATQRAVAQSVTEAIEEADAQDAEEQDRAMDLSFEGTS